MPKQINLLTQFMMKACVKSATFGGIIRSCSSCAGNDESAPGTYPSSMQQSTFCKYAMFVTNSDISDNICTIFVKHVD